MSEDVYVDFLHPVLVAGAAALQKHQPVKKRLRLAPGVTSYAETIGLNDVLNGYDPRPPQKYKTYSGLTKLNSPELVEQVSGVISDFVYVAYRDFDTVATLIAKSIGELHDNVTSHSRGTGYSCAQIYKNDLWFVVADNGIGMKRNVARIEPVQSDYEAIEWCLKKNNTTARQIDEFAQRLPADAFQNPYPPSVSIVQEDYPNHHQGLGLWHLSELVRKTSGDLHIWSGSSQFIAKPSGVSKRDTSRIWEGTLLCIRLPLEPNHTEMSQWNQSLEELSKRLGIT